MPHHVLVVACTAQYSAADTLDASGLNSACVDVVQCRRLLDGIDHVVRSIALQSMLLLLLLLASSSTMHGPCKLEGVGSPAQQ